MVIWGGSFDSVFLDQSGLNLVIYSGISVYCMRLFISVASLSWIEVNFVNKNLCIQSRPGVFQFDIF